MGCLICGAAVYAKGLCRSHYMRERRYGDPAADVPRGAAKTPMRLYLERKGEWDAMLDGTSERSRKKFLKALNQLYTAAGWFFDYSGCRAGTQEADVVAVAKALAFDGARFDFTNLERDAEAIFASEDSAQIEQWLPGRTCRRPLKA